MKSAIGIVTKAALVLLFVVFPSWRQLRALQAGSDVSASLIPKVVATGAVETLGWKAAGRIALRSSRDITDSPWGVCCHWITDPATIPVERQLDLLSSLGAKWALVLPDWNRVERKKGEYKFNTPDHPLGEVLKGLAERKIRPLIQIYGGNRLYMPERPDPNGRILVDPTDLLTDGEVRHAWAAFVTRLVEFALPYQPVWEIWNEPNDGFFWSRPASPAEYAEVVALAGHIIRRVDPQAVIIAGATATIPLTWFEQFLSHPVSRTYDYLSFHPYETMPERTLPLIRSLRGMAEKAGVSTTLWQTECGIASSAETAGWGYGGPWSEEFQAKWVLRRMLCDWKSGARVSIYFVLNDYLSRLEGGPRRGEMGVNAKGLFRYGTWEPKPAARAFANLASLVDENFEVVSDDENFAAGLRDHLPAELREDLHWVIARDRLTASTVIFLWLAAPPDKPIKPFAVNVPANSLVASEPILLDLIDGNVYELPDRGDPAGERLIPLADSPIVLCDKEVLTLRGLLPQGTGSQ